VEKIYVQNVFTFNRAAMAGIASKII
jgi:hypothetical protein